MTQACGAASGFPAHERGVIDLPWMIAMPFRLRTLLAAAAGWLKPTLGVLLAVFGLLVLTGADRAIETAVLDRLPDWRVLLTVRF